MRPSSKASCAALSWPRFYQVPSVAPRIAPDRHAPIGFIAGDFFTDRTCRDKPRLICCKVIAVQEKPDTTATLRADCASLDGACWLCQHKAASTSGGLHRDPALGALGHILAQRVQPKPLQKKPMASSWSGTIKEIAPSREVAAPGTLAGSVTGQPHFGQGDARDLLGNRIH